ncbi:MAG: DUF4160 domain-containing protein [Oligoflexia bacterium]|nr:DUF4160 domain-containing protein [Oligoflexia bacterium]
MGTVIVYRNVRIVIRTNDHNPPHVHVIRGDAEAKIEIGSREIHYSKGFSKRDLERIVDFMASQEDLLLEAWNEIHKED